MDSRAIIIGPEHLPVLSASLGMYMTYLTTALQRNEMDAEDLMDFMEVYTTAGNLWRKSLRGQGMPQDEINELLALPSELDKDDD